MAAQIELPCGDGGMIKRAGGDFNVDELSRFTHSAITYRSIPPLLSVIALAAVTTSVQRIPENLKPLRHTFQRGGISGH
jgi:hypothetical protein